MTHPEFNAQGAASVDITDICRGLSIIRSTLGRWRRREVLGHGQLSVRKNPAAPRSDLFWHRQRCSALMTSTCGCCGAIAESSPVQGQRVDVG